MESKKANLISIVLFVITVLFVHFSVRVEAAPSTFWFNNAVNTSPLELGNYWTDDGQTVQALALPDFDVDRVNIVAGAIFNGNAIFNLTATNAGTVTGNAIFYNDSVNQFPAGQINGDATFYNNSIDKGIIYGDAFFHDNSLHEDANAYGDITFYDNAICSISNNYGYVTFNDDSVSIGGLVANATFNDNSVANVFITGNVIFNDNSLNSSTILGDATFNDSSQNGNVNITPITNVIFNNNSINNGVIHGNAIFNHASTNNEDVLGNATFVNDLSQNSPSASATTKIREYTIDTTTTRDFLTDGPWTVIANAAIVNVTGATYNSTTTLTARNGGSFIPSFTSGGGGNLYTQTPVKGPFSIVINDMAKETDNYMVNIDISVGQNITRMAVSNSPSFEKINLIPLAQKMQWNLCSITSGCSDGEYTVYARFYTEYGQVSEQVSDSIVYKSKSPTIELEKTLGKEAVISKKYLENIQSNFSLHQQLFTKNLRFRNVAQEVKLLQQFLNAHNFPLRVSNRGAGSPGKETFYFGPYTRRAVQKYQQANSLPITGRLDSATRKVINSQIEKGTKL